MPVANNENVRYKENQYWVNWRRSDSPVFLCDRKCGTLSGCWNEVITPDAYILEVEIQTGPLAMSFRPMMVHLVGIACKTRIG